MNKRKNYFIDKPFQSNFIVKFCLLVASTGVLIMLALFIMTKKATTVSFVNSRVVVQSTADFLLPVLIQTVIIATIIVSIATIVFTLFISHRIAGPAYRFKKILLSLAQGNFCEGCRIRRTDSLQDVAAEMNNMITNVRGSLVSMDISTKSMEEKLEEMISRRGAQDPELKEFKKYIMELDKKLHHFKF